MDVSNNMLTTDDFPNTPFHFVSVPPPDTNFVLLAEIDKALEGVRLARELLLNTSFANGRGEFIKPIECDQIDDISKEIREVTTTISQKLKSMDGLHVLSTANYHKILMHLYSAIDRSRKLTELMRQFRPICLEETSQQRNYFMKAHQEVSVFAKTCAQIEAETEEFIDSMFMKYSS
jgi:hypothetical protein